MKFIKHDGSLGVTKGYKGDLGIDLITPVDATIWSGGSIIIDTKTSIEFPSISDVLGHMIGKLFGDTMLIGAFVKSKSGLSCKHNIEVGAGVIDPNYTGTLKVHLYNFGSEEYNFKAGDKIAQVVFQPVFNTDIKTTNKDRNSKGFGSSGK